MVKMYTFSYTHCTRPIFYLPYFHIHLEQITNYSINSAMLLLIDNITHTHFLAVLITRYNLCEQQKTKFLPKNKKNEKTKKTEEIYKNI